LILGLQGGIIGVNSVLGSIRRVGFGDVDGVSEMFAAYAFMVEMESRMYPCNDGNIAHFHNVFSPFLLSLLGKY
jgi:hypothetical protein